MSKVAFIAAEAFELAPLERRALPGNPLFAHAGPGFRAARQAAETVAGQGATLLVSVGLCGALAPDLRRGDIVVDEEGARPRSARAFRQGRLVSQDRVASTAAEKAELAARGIAVEMESRAVREVAQRHGLPYSAVKVVSDLADEAMPLDFNAYREEGGRFDQRRIAIAVALRPWLVPGLLRLRRDALDAAEKLGDFLAHCEF